MDAGELMRRLVDVIDAHHWDGLGELLHPEFVCRLVHTGEVFDRDDWVRLNAEYPGFEHMELRNLVADAEGQHAATRCHVTGRAADGTIQHFEVADFATTRDGLVTELIEVWADIGQPPPPGTRPSDTP